VVPHLGGVVEDAAGRRCHDGPERHLLPLGAVGEAVEVVDVRTVVLAVVIVDGLG
jgi:hypothetical protein